MASEKGSRPEQTYRQFADNVRDSYPFLATFYDNFPIVSHIFLVSVRRGSKRTRNTVLYCIVLYCSVMVRELR